MKRKLTPEETSEILKLTRDDINMDLLRSYFAVIGRKSDHARFNTFDTFTLPKGKLYNSETIETTIGRYLVNLFVLPDKYLKANGYQNIVFDADSLGDIEKKLASMLLLDEITTKDFAEYLDNGEWISIGTAYFLVPTMNYEMNVPIKEVIQKRDELFAAYSKEIAEGDPNIASKIEAEILPLAKKLIKEKGNQGYDFFESGEFNFSNNYKKTSIMAGAVENPYTHKLNILKSNYIDGLDKHEFPKFTNLTIIGGYSRGVETQKGGYETKKINNSMQVVTLDDAGSDCHTPYYVDVTIDKATKNMFLYRYVLLNGKETMLTEDNIKEVVGKRVKMRSPIFCKDKNGICNRCAGELFYKLGTKNAGLFCSTMSGSLMNLMIRILSHLTERFVLMTS